MLEPAMSPRAAAAPLLPPAPDADEPAGARRDSGHPSGAGNGGGGGHASGGATLARRAAAGDRDALGLLVREHARVVFDVCYHVVGAADARDAAQEALERICTTIARFDAERGAFRPWALTVARNVCRDRLRRRGLERVLFDQDDDGAAVAEYAPAAGLDPERAALLRAESARLEAALETLPVPMRTALVLFHVHEASYEEIAQALDVPMGTVMTWLHRGRKRLRAAVETHDGGDDDDASRGAMGARAAQEAPGTPGERR